MATNTSEDSDALTSNPGPKLSKRTWRYMAKRVLAEFGRDKGTDQAAKLTYFMVLSIAPTLLALFSLVTLLLHDFKDQVKNMLVSAITDSGIAGGGASEVVGPTVDSIMGKPGSGTVALIVGILTALWSASAYIKAFGRVSNDIYEIPEGRGPIKLNLSMVLITAGLILTLLLIMVSLLLNQTLVTSVLGPLADPIGASGLLAFLTQTFLPVWAWVKWPVIVLLLFLAVAMLYWAAPNIKRPFRFFSPGGAFAILGIAVAGVVLSIYMGTIASYSSYGAIGGMMAILFVLWVMNIVLILGAEVDAEFERAKELQAGKPAEGSLDLPLRGEKGAEKKEQKYEELVDTARDIRLRNLHRDNSAYTGEGSRLTGTTSEGKTRELGEGMEEARQREQNPRGAWGESNPKDD